MSNERHARLRALYEEVVDLPHEQRMAVLRQRSDDESLIAEVAALCRATDGDDTTRLFAPLDAALKSTTVPSLAPGDVLDVWRIAREIGQGGMGAVFLVERSDGHFAQSAALKLVKGLQRAGTLNYFSRERQLLATLTHPNIARLLDGGATPGGHPYLVMEYIDGVNIDAWCRDKHLSRAQVLTLFSTACEAVAFAHRQLVVHCDLKPSNLMVDRSGRPVLLDFGIARLIERVGAEADDAAIGSSIAYTPRYASPEQREHGVVSTVSDIYSLGVLLGELVAITGKADVEMKAILAKATAELPERRYATVDALVGDLRRYLAREPLQAVLPTPQYLTRKFLQRRWPLVLAGAAFAVTVAGFTWRVVQESDRAVGAEKTALAERDRAQAAEQQAVKERDATALARAEALRERDVADAARTEAEGERERTAQAEKRALGERDSARRSEDRAVAERNRATAAQRSSAQFNAFLLSIFENEELADTDSPDIPAVRIIDAAAARVEGELSGQPETQTAIYRALGIIYANLGRPRQGIDAFEHAIALDRTLDRPLDLADVLSRTATLRSAGAESALAEKYAREALALLLRHTGPDATAASDTQLNLGILLSRLSRWDESRELLLAALAARERLYGRESLQFAEANVALGRHYNVQPGSTGEALSYLDTALAIYTRLQGESSRGAMTTLAARAFALRKLGRFDESVADHRRAVALRRKAHGESSMHVATAMLGLGATLAEIGRPLEAAATLREAVTLRKKNEPAPSTLLATSLMRLAEACMASGDMAGAGAAFAEAVAILRKTLPPGDSLVARALYLQGQFLVRDGRAAEADAPLTESYEIWRKLFGENGSDTFSVKLAMVERDLALGNIRAASERIAALARDADRPATRVGYLRDRGLVAARAGNLDAGLADLVEAEERQRKAGGDHDLRAWRIALDRARVLADAGRRTEAAALAERITAKLMPHLVSGATELAELRKLQQP